MSIVVGRASLQIGCVIADQLLPGVEAIFGMDIINALGRVTVSHGRIDFLLMRRSAVAILGGGGGGAVHQHGGGGAVLCGVGDDVVQRPGSGSAVHQHGGGGAVLRSVGDDAVQRPGAGVVPRHRASGAAWHRGSHHDRGRRLFSAIRRRHMGRALEVERQPTCVMEWRVVLWQHHQAGVAGPIRH